MGSFTDPAEGKWKWTPGIQWVCDYSKNSVDYMLLKAITGGKVSFSPLDDECQIKYFPDLDYQFCFVNDKGRMLEKLHSEFPDEAQKIERYFKYLDILEEKSCMFSLPKRFPPGLAKIMFAFSKALKMLPHMDKSVAEVVDQVLKIENEKLRAIFLSFSHYFGIPLDEIPFPFYAYAQNMQFNGMFYPVGGDDAWYYMSLDGKEALQSSGLQIEEELSLMHYNMNRVKLGFLNPNTREENLEPSFLIRFKTD